MAYRITRDCNLCDACVTECPNEAITAGANVYVIDAAKCTECVGFFHEAQCAAVCPQECCEPDPDRYDNILRIDVGKSADGSHLEVFARGVRNSVGFDWHPQTRELWFTDIPEWVTA